ncbi:PAS domain S-box protein, partial [bacterium]|nr:PAS domain S-box protein [bacterium]
MSNQRGVDLHQQEKLSEAFEELFILLEELRLAEKELRVKDDELMSMREIMEIERERYQELFEHAPDAYLLTDPDITVQQFNHAAAELFQIPNVNLFGLTLMLFIDESHHQILRDHLSILRKQEIVKGIELKVQPKNGPVLFTLLTLGAIHDAENTLTGIHWFLRDITKQKEAEQALLLSEERFRSIAASARDAIIVADDKSNILSWNKGAEQMFLYPENEIVGKPLSHLLPPRYKENEKAFQVSGDSPNIGKATEVYGARKDGSEFPIEISLSRWNANGNNYFTSIIRDISERKLAEETRIKLLERILAGQEEDRRWIARELHDETGQSLSALLVGLRMIEESRTLKKAKLEASRLRSITAQTLDDVGRLAKGLRPIILDDLGLMVALKRHAADFARSFNISIEFKSRGLDSGRLPLAAETALFRIAQ